MAGPRREEKLADEEAACAGARSPTCRPFGRWRRTSGERTAQPTNAALGAAKPFRRAHAATRGFWFRGGAGCPLVEVRCTRLPHRRRRSPCPGCARRPRAARRLVMVTAYDYPQARAADAGGRRPRPGRRLARHGRPRPRRHPVGDHGRDAPPREGGAARRRARAARRRHAVRLVPPRTPSRRSPTPCASSRRAAPQAVKIEGARVDVIAALVAAEIPVHGPPRPDAAVDPQVRRLQGAGARRRGARRRCSTRRAASRRPAPSRWCSSASRRSSRAR